MRRLLLPILAAVSLCAQQGQKPAAEKKERDLKFEKDPVVTEPVAPPGGKSIPRSYALVVGVGDYQNLPPAAKLAFAERDAEAVYSILISPEGGNFRAENVKKLTGAKATLANMKRELETWLPGVAKADDRVLVYFAGHGFVDPKSGKAFLAPYDLNPSDIANTGYGMDQLGKIIGSSVQAKWKVLLTDSCHSGAITPEQGEIVNRSLLDLNRSMFSMTASRARERSFESKDWGGGHGIFTYYVVRGMEGYADENKDSIVTADELAEYVRRNVREATKGQQNPTVDKGNFDPQMLLAFLPSRVSPGEAPAPKFGTWVIEANMDNVEVFVDGASKGVIGKGTPLRLPGLPPGVHTVRGVRMGYEPDGPREETVYPGQESTISIKITIPRRRTKAAVEPFEKGVEQYNNGNKEAYTKALGEFRAAIAADPTYSQAWLYLARVQRDLFQIEESEKSFRKALEIDPDYLEARATFGGMLLDNGNVDESIRQLNAVVQRDPKHGMALSLLAQALRMKSLYPDSIETARKALQVNPRNAETHFWLAESLRMSGKYPDAVSEYQQYLQLSDFDSKLAGKMNYYVLGYLAGMGRKKRAAQTDVWADMRSLAYFGLCDCERLQDRFDEAIAYCTRSLRYDNQEPYVHYVLALSYARRAKKMQSVEQYAAARSHFQKVLDINPDLAEADYARKNIQAIDAALR
ncbi:MAG TPA: tetratricopeptide repeat protein [Bryobacteraceae bacterium]|nr:tetratricopeptide repeat protein [Bryobacteraceae bacterium]